ncbi:MAG: hypothetical protein H6706_16825 [Myxococcales bacterium]|nr:hypothetical protein [Myxococcales bacterium]
MRTWPLLLLALAACDDAAVEVAAGVPVLDEARPGAARPGQEVTLLGRGLGRPGPQDEVRLAGVRVEILAWEDRTLKVRVPTLRGPAGEYQRGVFDWVVRSGRHVSAPLAFEVLPPPP